MQVIFSTNYDITSSKNNLVVTISKKALGRYNYELEFNPSLSAEEFFINDVKRYVNNRSNKYLSNTACSKINNWLQANPFCDYHVEI